MPFLFRSFALLVLSFSLQAEVTLQGNIAFDSDRREVLAADGFTVLDSENFRQFPNFPTKKGVDNFRKLLEDAGARGMRIQTKLVDWQGKVTMLADVGDSNDPLLHDFNVGQILETMIRSSRQAALNLLRDTINSRNR